jgi:hypothetical protein
MPRARRTAAAIRLSFVLGGAGRAAAQGVAGAAIQGTIGSADSTAVQDATVLVTNGSTGERWQTTATGTGRYFVEHLSVGGRREPWFSELDARLTKVLPTARGQSLELSADCFNLLNLLDRHWGLARFTSGASGGLAQTSLLELAGYDEAHGRGVYRLLAPTLREVDQAQSRWRLRLSARYTF